MQNDDPSTPWYCEYAPLAPFSIYFLLSDPSFDYDKARKRILGSWTLDSLYVDGDKQLISPGSEIIIIDLKYIRAKREREEIPLKAGKLLIPYIIIDKSHLTLSEKEKRYIVIKVLTFSKNSLNMEYTDVSKEGNIAGIRKHWIRT